MCIKINRLYEKINVINSNFLYRYIIDLKNVYKITKN